MTKEIDKVMEFIAKHFVFDENAYPELKGKSEEEKLKFAVRHCALHFSKTAGKVVAVSESVDHGNDINLDSLREDVPKAFINTLRLAELVGMSGEDIVKAVEEKYKA